MNELPIELLKKKFKKAKKRCFQKSEKEYGSKIFLPKVSTKSFSGVLHKLEKARLKKVILEGCFKKDSQKTLDVLESLIANTNIEEKLELNLSGNAVDDYCISKLCTLICQKSIKSLKLAKLINFDGLHCAELLKTVFKCCKHLEVLDISFCELNWFSLRWLEQILSNNAVTKRLVLTNCRSRMGDLSEVDKAYLLRHKQKNLNITWFKTSKSALRLYYEQEMEVPLDVVNKEFIKIRNQNKNEKNASRPVSLDSGYLSLNSEKNIDISMGSVDDVVSTSTAYSKMRIDKEKDHGKIDEYKNKLVMASNTSDGDTMNEARPSTMKYPMTTKKLQTDNEDLRFQQYEHQLKWLETKTKVTVEPKLISVGDCRAWVPDHMFDGDATVTLRIFSNPMHFEIPSHWLPVTSILEVECDGTPQKSAFVSMPSWFIPVSDQVEVYILKGERTQTRKFNWSKMKNAQITREGVRVQLDHFCYITFAIPVDKSHLGAIKVNHALIQKERILKTIFSKHVDSEFFNLRLELWGSSEYKTHTIGSFEMKPSAESVLVKLQIEDDAVGIEPQENTLFREKIQNLQNETEVLSFRTKVQMENDGMSVDATYFIGEEISELIEIKLPENKRSRKRKRSREMPNSILKRPKLSVHLHDTKICAENNIQDRARVRISKKHSSAIVQQKLSRPQDKSESETSCEEMEND